MKIVWKKSVVFVLSALLAASLASCNSAQQPASSQPGGTTAATSTAAALSTLPTTQGSSEATQAPTQSTTRPTNKRTRPATQKPSTKPVTKPATSENTTKAPTTTQKPTESPQAVLQAAFNQYDAASQKLAASQVLHTRMEQSLGITMTGMTITTEMTSDILASNTDAVKAMLRTVQMTALGTTTETKEYAGAGMYYISDNLQAAGGEPIPLSDAELESLLTECLYTADALTLSEIDSYKQENGYMVFTANQNIGDQVLEMMDEEMDDLYQELQITKCILYAKLDTAGNLVEEKLDLEFQAVMSQDGVSLDISAKMKMAAAYQTAGSFDFSKPDWAAAMDVAA